MKIYKLLIYNFFYFLLKNKIIHLKIINEINHFLLSNLSTLKFKFILVYYNVILS